MIQLTPQERVMVDRIWKNPDRTFERERVAAIEAQIGHRFTRGWRRLHFGPPGGSVQRAAVIRTPEEIRKKNEDRRAYHWQATGSAMNPGMNYLSDLIIRPGIEKRFGPLLLYRGAMNRGRAHRAWNFVLLMMAAGAETMSDGLKLAGNAAFAQLCGPLRAPTKPALWSFLFRLYDNPAVTRNIGGLTDYVKSLRADQAWELRRVDRFSDRRFCAEWRLSTHPNAGEEPPERGIPKSKQLFYPYLVHDPAKKDDGRDLVLLANSIVPHHLPDYVRADLCQELIVSILSGEIKKENARDHMEIVQRRYYKTQPFRYEQDRLAPLSMDAPIYAGETETLYDRISASASWS